MKLISHVPGCRNTPENKICHKPHKLSNGSDHWWSGWPGAFCLGCGASDEHEMCIMICNWDFEMDNPDELKTV